MKKLKGNVKGKVLVGVLATTIVVGGLFTAGGSRAADSWINNVINDASKSLTKVAFDKTADLLANNSINDQMKEALNPEIKAQELELEALLEEYYRMKLEGLTETEEYKNVEAKIAEIKIISFNRYKSDIDAAFDAQ